jgi:hypothetical protein
MYRKNKVSVKIFDRQWGKFTRRILLVKGQSERNSLDYEISI